MGTFTTTSAFQFTPLREGRRRLAGRRTGACAYFNSRPSARGDRAATEAKLQPWLISIHAPPRGATEDPMIYKKQDIISIHAPPRGATQRRMAARQRNGAFQFTPLREGRPATGRRITRLTIFQFTPLREGRPRSPGERRCTASFQFTPLREGRRLVVFLSFVAFHFNSRPSARGDSKRYAISANLLFNPYKSAWLNNNATQFVEIILVIFHRIIA